MRVHLIACRICGKDFAPKGRITRIREQLNLPDEIACTCPRCRSSRFREILEEYVYSKKLQI